MSTIHDANFKHWHWVIPNPSGKRFHYVAVRAGDHFGYAENLSDKKFDKLRGRLEAGESIRSLFASHKVVSAESIEHLGQGKQLGGVIVTCRAGAKPRRIKLLQADDDQREKLFASVAATLAPGVAMTDEPVAPREALQAPALIAFLCVVIGSVFWSVAYSTANEPGGASGSGSRRYQWVGEIIDALGTFGVLGVIGLAVLACGIWGAIRLVNRATKQVVRVNDHASTTRRDATIVAV